MHYRLSNEYKRLSHVAITSVVFCCFCFLQPETDPACDFYVSYLQYHALKSSTSEYSNTIFHEKQSNCEQVNYPLPKEKINLTVCLEKIVSHGLVLQRIFIILVYFYKNIVLWITFVSCLMLSGFSRSRVFLAEICKIPFSMQTEKKKTGKIHAVK